MRKIHLKERLFGLVAYRVRTASVFIGLHLWMGMLLLALTVSVNPSLLAEKEVHRRSELFVRDPFIVPSKETREYYLYSSNHRDELGRRGVYVFKSKDLNSWVGPQLVFSVPTDAWADPYGEVWAPEVHAYEGRYYLFVTLANKHAPFKAFPGRPPNHVRATQIFRSDSLEGPFLPMGKSPHTPGDWMSLDGTLAIEEGKPHMVFCREWQQTIDGTFELVELASDLSKPMGDPTTLFAASQIPWTRDLKGVDGRTKAGYVSDGCFMYRTETGQLLMLTSSFGDTRYSVGVSRSKTGRLAGPWVHEKTPLYPDNGGHGMLFTTFEGALVLSLHAPDSDARCRLFEIEDTGDSLKIMREIPW